MQAYCSQCLTIICILAADIVSHQGPLTMSAHGLRPLATIISGLLLTTCTLVFGNSPLCGDGRQLVPVTVANNVSNNEAAAKMSAVSVSPYIGPCIMAFTTTNINGRSVERTSMTTWINWSRLLMMLSSFSELARVQTSPKLTDGGPSKNNSKEQDTTLSNYQQITVINYNSNANRSVNFTSKCLRII